MSKIFEKFLTGLVGTCVLVIPVSCILVVAIFQSALLETQKRVEQVSKHLVYVEERLNYKPPEIVYQVDSYGGNLHGKITAKEQKENGYAVEIGSYGWFLVTEEQYEALNIGDDAPEYLKGRGN